MYNNTTRERERKKMYVLSTIIVIGVIVMIIALLFYQKDNLLHIDPPDWLTKSIPFTYLMGDGKNVIPVVEGNEEAALQRYLHRVFHATNDTHGSPLHDGSCKTNEDYIWIDGILDVKK
jgi:hypothetical protein